MITFLSPHPGKIISLTANNVGWFKRIPSGFLKSREDREDLLSFRPRPAHWRMRNTSWLHALKGFVSVSIALKVIRMLAVFLLRYFTRSREKKRWCDGASLWGLERFISIPFVLKIIRRQFSPSRYFKESKERNEGVEVLCYETAGCPHKDVKRKFCSLGTN